jgi:hypothetical protein
MAAVRNSHIGQPLFHYSAPMGQERWFAVMVIGLAALAVALVAVALFLL